MELNELLDRFNPPADQIATARERQAQVWRGDTPDTLPILLSGRLPDDLAALPRYNLKECWFDREKMLWNGVLDMEAAWRSGGDSVPSVRANLGCGIMATPFGCTQSVFEDKMPWIEEHLTFEQAADADISRPETRGDIPRVLEYMACFQEQLADKAAAVYCSDVQGPFDIAHLVVGDALFYAMYDRPEAVHTLVGRCTDVYTGVLRAMKAVNGERPDESWHYNCLYIDGAGTRTSEDSTTLIAEEHVADFAVPYTVRAFEPFGGYVHYCGDGRTMLHRFMPEDTVKGFNFGNPEMHDMPQVMADLLDAGKVYFGGFPRADDETLRAYFTRVLGYLDGARRGLIFRTGLRDGDPDPRAAVDLWRELQ